MIETDVLIIGSGIAGLTAAYYLGENNIKTIIITKEEDSEESNTLYAQGGIVGRGSTDDPEALKKDIMSAGDGISNPDAIDIITGRGVFLVKEFLIDKIDVPFTRDEKGEILYTKEANHSRRRILFAKDESGKAIEKALVDGVKKQKSVKMLTCHTAIDLITTHHHSENPLRIYKEPEVLGAYVFNRKRKKVEKIFAKAVILASGGLGRIFLHTTNPPVARGDGYAMADRAGAQLINMEYIQFHPTSFYHRDADRFLISEAVRGEGAILINKKGRAFMEDYSKKRELAPRDVVSRAIYEEMIKNNDDYVLLDLSKIKMDVKERFPHIYETCKINGVDITKEPIPVVPAAHYSCGGVKVDGKGRTTLKRLYAVGEVSCTGLHGANRLASTSLLEGLTWGYLSAMDIMETSEILDAKLPFNEIPDWKYPKPAEKIDPALIVQDWNLIRSTMWNYAGIIRTRKRLIRAKSDLEYLKHRIEKFYKGARVEDSIIGLRNSVQTALIVIRAAITNPISRGAHFIITED
jgi:L-aspartate oxidase